MGVQKGIVTRKKGEKGTGGGGNRFDVLASMATSSTQRNRGVGEAGW